MGLKNVTSETEQLLTEHYEKYYRLAYSYLQNEEDALDAVQESAYRAIRDCGKIKNKDYLSTWIYRIVINVSLDMLRKNKKVTPVEELPEIAVEDSYGESSLTEVLETLDDKSRTVILLRYFEDLKLEDIAIIVGKNLNTVKARLYRALKKLRLNLEADKYNEALEHF